MTPALGLSIPYPTWHATSGKMPWGQLLLREALIRRSAHRQFGPELADATLCGGKLQLASAPSPTTSPRSMGSCLSLVDRRPRYAERLEELLATCV